MKHSLIALIAFCLPGVSCTVATSGPLAGSLGVGADECVLEMTGQETPALKTEAKSSMIWQKKAANFKDDAPPFSDLQRAQYRVDPDQVYKIAREVIASRDDAGAEEDDLAFLEHLKQKLNEEMPFINVKAKKLRNVYHDIVGDIYVLFATKNQYIILFKVTEVYSQERKPFMKLLSPDAQQIVRDGRLGYSGRYPTTEFRTIAVTGQHITLTQNGEKHVHEPGDRAFLAPGTWKAYTSGWILECAHGQLWKAFPHFLLNGQNRWSDIGGQMGSVAAGTWYDLRHPRGAAGAKVMSSDDEFNDEIALDGEDEDDPTGEYTPAYGER